MARRSADPVRRPTVSVQLDAIGPDGHVHTRPVRLATEEPMELRVHGPGEAPRSVAVTMRTPGNDFELAVGFLHGEGLLRSHDELDRVAYCLGPDGEQEYNVVTVRLRGAVGDALRPRALVSTSSCGVCGSATLDDLERTCAPLHDVGLRVAWSAVQALPGLLAEQQVMFDATGGIHAAGLATADGTVVAVREDVGRHNALDKLVGHALLQQELPLHEHVLVVSGRLGYELVQKAAMAGITVLCAVGAPSSLAIDTARRFGQTVVAFLRDDRANVYTYPDRIDLGA